MKTPLQTTGFFAILFSLLVLIFGAEVKGQNVFKYDFGNTVGTIGQGETVNSGIGSILIPTQTDGGTARVRIATAGGGGFIENPGNPDIGSLSQLRLVSSSSTAVNFFQLWDYDSSPLVYFRFTMRLNDSEDGRVDLILGSSSSADFNSTASRLGAGFTVIRWHFREEGFQTRYRNALGNDVLGGINGEFLREEIYTVEIYANNSSSAENYYRSGEEITILEREWALYLNGNHIGNFDGATSQVIADVNLDAIRFQATGSGDNSSQIEIDDIYYSNTFPIFLIAEQGLGEGWRMMSNPADGATFRNLLKGNVWTQGFPGSDFPDPGQAAPNVYLYSEPDQQWQPIAHLNDAMPVGRGFMVYMYNANHPNAAPVWPKNLYLAQGENPANPDVTISRTAVGDADLQGWNLIGNPYATAFNAYDFVEANGDLADVVYVYSNGFDATGQPVGLANDHSYIAWNGTVGALPNGRVSAFQGFFVERSTVGSSDFTLDEAFTVSANTDFYNLDESRSLELVLDNYSRKTSAFFSFTPEGMIGQDSRDAYYLKPMVSQDSDQSTFLSVYSVNTDGNALNINNLPLELTEEIQIPLHASMYEFDTEIAADLRLSWPRFTNIPDNWDIRLYDSYNDAYVNLRDASDYEFSNQFTLSNTEKLRSSGGMLRQGILSNAPETRFKLVINPNSSTSGPVDGEHPQQLRLSQNYPNPFNPTTRINYELPEASEVALDVFDIHGRHVATLVNAHQNPGSYTVVFDASRLASGVYVYRLSANGNVVSNRMTLIK